MSQESADNSDARTLIDELKKLRRTGLRRKKGRLPTLEAVAEQLISDSETSAYEKIKGAIESAAKEMAPDRCAAIRELLDAGELELRRVEPRREKAAEILDISKKHFEEEVEAGLLEELAEWLVTKAANKRMGSAPPEPDESDDAGPLRDDASDDVRQVVLLPKQLLAYIRQHSAGSRVVAIVALFAIVAVVLWASDGADSVPPVGSVVNADTGEIVAHPVVKPSPMPAQIGGGGDLHACDRTADPSCASATLASRPRMKVKTGDVIEFSMTLNDGYSEPVHYLKLEAFSYQSGNQLLTTMFARWPETAQKPYEKIGEPTVTPVHLVLPDSGSYELQYIPGSTMLVNRSEHFAHHLPDGITEDGIALEDVGSPSSCFWCAQRYIRWVDFRTRVVRTSSISPPSSNPHTIVPRKGAVVNAENGNVSYGVRAKPVTSSGTLGGGHVLEACIITNKQPCKYASTLHAEVGSLVNLSMMLFDTSDKPVQYVKLTVTDTSFGTMHDEPFSTLKVTASAVSPPLLNGSPDVSNRFLFDSIFLKFAHPGHYELSYIHNSTRLLGYHGRLVNYLPNGVMEFGVALQDVGAPASCFMCNTQYERYVDFHAKVVERE